MNCCIVCNKDFLAKRKDAKYCSSTCYRVSYREKTSIQKKCTICGNVFECRDKETVCCSIECVYEYKKKNKTHKENCIFCGEEYLTSPSNKRKKYCSEKCGSLYRAKKQITIKCVICGDDIKTNRSNKKKICSSECKEVWIRENLVGENHHNYINRVRLNCSCCGKEIVKTKARFIENKTKSYFCSNDCQRDYFIGENSPNWDGGAKIIQVAIRRDGLIRESRAKCFERDNYMSVVSNKKGRLNAHHIKSISYLIEKHNITLKNLEKYKNIIYSVDNLATLTEQEHKRFHSIYGNSTTDVEFRDYLKILNK